VEPCERPRTSYRQSLADGISVVRANPAIAGALLVSTATEGFAFSFIPLVPVFATDILDVGATGLGLMLAAEGFGAIGASLAVAMISRRVAYGRLMLAGSILSLLLGFGLAASPWYGLTFVLLVALGGAGWFYHIMQSSVILSMAPREMRGRLIGLQMLVIGMFPLGALTVGALASLLSPQAAVMIMSTIGIVMLSVIASRFRVIWRGPASSDTVPEPQTAG
jgi:MFS family permease